MKRCNKEKAQHRRLPYMTAKIYIILLLKSSKKKIPGTNTTTKHHISISLSYSLSHNCICWLSLEGTASPTPLLPSGFLRLTHIKGHKA